MFALGGRLPVAFIKAPSPNLPVSPMLLSITGSVQLQLSRRNQDPASGRGMPGSDPKGK